MVVEAIDDDPTYFALTDLANKANQHASLLASHASDQAKIKGLIEAGSRLIQWTEGYQRLANEKGGRYAVAISSARSDVELFRAALKESQS